MEGNCGIQNEKSQSCFLHVIIRKVLYVRRLQLFDLLYPGILSIQVAVIGLSCTKVFIPWHFILWKKFLETLFFVSFKTRPSPTKTAFLDCFKHFHQYCGSFLVVLSVAWFSLATQM